MALKIRLQVGGRKHHRKYRVVVTEALARRDGRHVEILGFYNPQPKGEDVKCKLKLERIDYWMSQGAKPTDTVKSLIRKAKRKEGKFTSYEDAVEAASAA